MNFSAGNGDQDQISILGRALPQLLLLPLNPPPPLPLTDLVFMSRELHHARSGMRPCRGIRRDTPTLRQSPGTGVIRTPPGNILRLSQRVIAPVRAVHINSVLVVPNAR